MLTFQRAIRSGFLPLSCILLPSIVFGGRIVSNPYAAVDWDSDYRLKTQFHDHVRVNDNRYIAYDEAGYDVISLMHYSGNPNLPQAWTERCWPPEQWLSEGLLNSFENIKFLIPNAEEHGPIHLTSPFLTTYIEHWNPAKDPQKQPYHYQTRQEAIDLISFYGGLPIVAHPWEGCCKQVTGYHATEIFNAFAIGHFLTGRLAYDHTGDLISFWDSQLMNNPRLYGVAVNDWFGPWQTGFELPSWVLDSGKTIVLASEPTPESFRQSVERGAMLAIKDFGDVKEQYPDIESIQVNGDEIVISTTGTVSWISNGVVVGSGGRFDASALTSEARYVRAEISDANGSTVYSQPWEIVFPFCGPSGNDVCSAEDIDSVRHAISISSTDPIFDANDDSTLNNEDFDFIIQDVNGTAFGDSNLDWRVNFEDFVILTNHFGQENVGWAAGNFNLDNVTNLDDLLLMTNSYDISLPAAGGVPEVGSLWITALVSAMGLGRRGRVIDLYAKRKHVL